jgi:5-methylthioadenosine/S-adenosylhomocysteine deaminase
VSRILIKQGTVVSLARRVGDFRHGDVLIEDDKIVDVAASIDAGDCDVLDAAGMVVLPGLVDTHRHLWQTVLRGDSFDSVYQDLVNVQWPRLATHFKPEDVYASTLSGAIDAVSHGVTTVLDFCHIMNTPDHGEENLRALRESGIRAVFGYGASMSRKLGELAGNFDNRDSWEHARQMRESGLRSDEGRITMALALQGPEFTSIEITRGDVAVARELGVPMTMHVGTPGGAPRRAAIGQLAEGGLLGADMNFSHCCTSSDKELALLAECGATATACPSIEMTMGMGDPVVGRLKEAGVRPAIGVDTVIATSGDMFDEMRAALWHERSRHARRLFEAEQEVLNTEQMHFSTREALESATVNGANACWLGDRTGKLAPGYLADVILLRAGDLNLWPLSDVVATLVGSGNGGNVDTVVIGGEIVKRGGAMLGVDVARAAGLLEATRDRIFSHESYSGMRPEVANQA